MLDHLHQWRLLLAHPRCLDVVCQDVGVIHGEKDTGHADGVAVIYPVVRTARVPGEVRRTAQEKRTYAVTFHQFPQAAVSRLPAHLRPSQRYSMSARSGFAFASQHFSLSAFFSRRRSFAGGCMVRSGSVLLQIGLICKLRPCCWNELVEGWLLEPAFGECLLAGVSKGSGLVSGYQGDRAPTEAGARETSPPGTMLFRCFYEGVQLGSGDFVVLAQRGVRGVHQTSELVEVPVSESLHRLEDAGVLGDDVPGAHQLCSREEIQVS